MIRDNRRITTPDRFEEIPLWYQAHPLIPRRVLRGEVGIELLSSTRVHERPPLAGAGLVRCEELSSDLFDHTGLGSGRDQLAELVHPHVPENVVPPTGGVREQRQEGGVSPGVTGNEGG